MKRQTDALQDTAALGLDTAHRISIPTWKIHSGVKMQITKQVSFMSGRREREREKKSLLFNEIQIPNVPVKKRAVVNLDTHTHTKKRGRSDISGSIQGDEQSNRKTNSKLK